MLALLVLTSAVAWWAVRRHSTPEDRLDPAAEQALDEQIQKSDPTATYVVHHAWRDCATITATDNADRTDTAVIARRADDGRWRFYASTRPTVDEDEVRDRGACTASATGAPHATLLDGYAGHPLGTTPTSSVTPSRVGA